MEIKVMDFNLSETLDCGQCFRWEKFEEGFIGIAGGKVVYLHQKDDILIIDCDENDYNDFWTEYFDLSRDYSKIKKTLEKDVIAKKAIDFCGGIRLLKQEPFETLISFIISANNNIPRIKKIINALCENFGEEVEYNHKTFYLFPKAEVIAKLNEEDLSIIKAGFRAKYILDAAKKVSSGEIVLEDVYSMSSDDGREYLKKIKGVGDKVADCVLLFAFQKFDVFPKDVWIKRVISTLYSIAESDISEFSKKKFNKFAGFAQQYLFYYAREGNI